MGYKKPNLQFKKGYIEFLEGIHVDVKSKLTIWIEAGIEPNSIDIVISNCVVNLSPNKRQVLQSVYNVLKAGGEFYFSDVYCDRRLPEKVRQHKILFGECIAGALYVNDFKHLAREIGFKDPRILEMNEIRIRDEELLEIIGNAKFYSITFRLFKLDDLEPLCEDYGQVATYNGLNLFVD